MGEQATEAPEPAPEPAPVKPGDPNGLPFFNWEQRKCTDIACLIVFILFWVGMLVVAIVAGVTGDINRLIYATDYKGVTCGTGTGPQAAKRIVYPRMTEDIYLAAQNANFNPTTALSNLDKIDFYGICVDECPMRDAVVCNYEARAEMDKTTWPAQYTTDREKMQACAGNGQVAGIDCEKIREFCWLNVLDTRSILFRCFTLFSTAESVQKNCTGFSETGECTRLLVTTTSTEERTAEDNLVFDQFNSAYQRFNSYFSDVANSWYVTMVSGFIISLLAAFAFVTLLRFCAGCIVYSLIVLTFVAGFAVLIVLYFKAGLIDESAISSVVGSVSSAGANATTNFLPDGASVSENNKGLYQAAAGTCTVLYIILIGVVIFVRERITIAISLIVESAKVVADAPLMTLFPVITALQIFALSMYWIFISGLMYTAGGTDTVGSSDGASAARLPGNSTFSKFTSNDAMTYMIGYNSFGFIWTATFLHSMGTMAIIYVTGVWYFNTHSGKEGMVEDETVESGNRALYKGYHLAWRFHAGSVAFGSCLVAIVIFLRLLVAYIMSQLDGVAKSNCLVRVLLTCLSCCLRCIHKCVKYITTAAYTIVVLHNKSFCASGAHVVPLLVSNAVRIGTMSTISFIVNLVGKLFVVFVAGGISFLWLDNAAAFQPDGSTPLSSAWLPVLFTMILAFAVASVFFGVYEHIIDAILICFLEDERMQTNHGGPGLESILADNVRIVDKKKKEEAKAGARPSIQIGGGDVRLATA